MINKDFFSRIVLSSVLLVGLLVSLFVLAPQTDATPFVTCEGGGNPTISTTPNSIVVSCPNGNTTVTTANSGGGTDLRVSCGQGTNTFYGRSGGDPYTTNTIWCSTPNSGPNAEKIRPNSWNNEIDSSGDQGGAREDGTPSGGSSGEGGSLDTDVLTNPSREDIAACDGSTECINNNPLVVLIKLAVNILSALVGVVVVAVIVIAGIQYSTSGGNPNAAAQAKKRILNAIIALVAYMFLFMIFQWLIPGGLL